MSTNPENEKGPAESAISPSHVQSIPGRETEMNVQFYSTDDTGVATRSLRNDREGYLLKSALAYAIEAIEELPSELQELSDQRDMKALLENIIESDAELDRVIQNARRRFRAKTDGVEK